MSSLTLSNYEKTKKLTEYVALFFLALALFFQNANSELFVGFWICISVVICSAGIVTYNDIQHEQWSKLLERGAALVVMVIFAVLYFLLLA